MLLQALLAIGLLSSGHGAWPVPARSIEAPLLVVLTPTGETRDGLPVFTPHPAATAHEAALARGFSGRLLRLYRWEQQFLARRDGSAVEPAYLLLSRNQGGFPRFGFWLDGVRKAGVGYVDLHEGSKLTGRFGAMDQIFPHELMHVIVQQLSAPPPPGLGGANQVHAIGVRTDRVTAFNEGFAEHVQVMAVDDEDAAPETGALAADPGPPALARARFDAYRRALEASWSLAPPARMGFALWFSQTEQALRYHGVKANLFAREVDVPEGVLTRRDLYPAYLLENILPGRDDAPAKSTSRLLATEGVMAALFSRWVRDPVLQRPGDDPSFYVRFGVDADEATPLDRAYLKIFAVLADRRTHDAASLVRGYVEMFPGEAEAVAHLVRGAGLTWPLSDAPEIWLANDQFSTGTTVFDQFRALPRVHTFDLNAASVVDLLTVEGVTPDLARTIQRGAPYASLEALAAVPGVSAGLLARLAAMRDGMARVREENARADIESIDLMRIFRPVFSRAAVWIAIGALLAAGLYRLVRKLSLPRLVLNGFTAASLGLLATWVLGAALQVGSGPANPALLPFLPVVAFGLPGAAWQFVGRRSGAEALRVACAWALACAPSLAITQPLW